MVSLLLGDKANGYDRIYRVKSSSVYWEKSNVFIFSGMRLQGS